LSIHQLPRNREIFGLGKIGVPRPAKYDTFPAMEQAPAAPLPRKRSDQPRVEPATIEDLPALTELVMELFAHSGDFSPDRATQERGLQLILEQPSRGRIFVLRTDHRIIGMVNLLFTISTARGGFVVLMEDVVVHPDHRGLGYGSMLVKYVIEFAKQKDFKRITLLTDRISAESQHFFHKHGFEYSNMIPMRMILD
jgi:N-acetylglutamate synthase-like GNAT family acetyltransferase